MKKSIMHAGRFSWFGLGLALVLGCNGSAGGGTGPDQPASAATASTSAALGIPEPIPATSAACGPGAYRHEGPDFCVELPPAARGKAPTTIENGIAFPGILFHWTPKASTAVVAEWKAPKRPAQHQGPFEIWTTEPVARGTYFLIFDATQHDTVDIYKVPSVSGVTVVEGETTVIRCTVPISVERGEDARSIAASRAADLAACKSLRLFGRS